MELCYNNNIHFSQAGVSAFQCPFLKFKFNSEISFDRMLQYTRLFQDLFSFILSRSTCPTFLKGYKSGSKIEVYFTPVHNEKDLTKQPPVCQLLCYNEVANRFAAIIENWISKESGLEPLRFLYFGTKYLPSLFIDNRFLFYILFYIQGIEAYSRLNQYNSDNSNNKIALRVRLSSILERYKDILNRFRVDNNIISGIVNTRNYYTHFSDELKKKALKDMFLFLATEQLELIIKIILLGELGFSNAEISDLAEKKTGLLGGAYLSFH